jgi:hypothetical protein
MSKPLQDSLCAFELSDWVFPVAHSANCCVQVKPTSEAAHPLNPWPLNQHPAIRGREGCTLLARRVSEGDELISTWARERRKEKTDDLKPQPGGDLA